MTRIVLTSLKGGSNAYDPASLQAAVGDVIGIDLLKQSRC